MRDNFNKKTIDVLSKRAGLKCSNPKCKRLTVGSNEIKDKSTSIGIAAHITAAAPGGARFNTSMTVLERCSVENGIWLCTTCATLIDRDHQKYSVSLLNEWKLAAEKETANDLSQRVPVYETQETKEVITPKLTLVEKAQIMRDHQRKVLEIQNFLRSGLAIEEARKQVRTLIAKLKEAKDLFEDPTIGFNFGITQRKEEMYGIGFKGKYICFNWCRPEELDINHAILMVTLFKRTGHHGIDLKDITARSIDYKFTRSETEGDGWVEANNPKSFITTDNLFESWFEKFLEYIK